MAFTHLHLHSEYSFLDGSIKIKDLFKKIKELGQNSVAITEHGNMHAMIQKYKLAKQEGIKLIFGSEIYLCEDIEIKDRKRHHLILLAENEEGLQNLIKITSIANTDGFYYKPRIDKKVLKKYSKGIICTSACIAGEIQKELVNGTYEKAREITKEYIDIFGKENFFLEFHNHGIPEENIANKGMFKLLEELNLKGIAACDSHYLEKSDSKAHEILLCIQTKNKMTNPNRFQFNGTGFYVKSESEMLELFPNNPELITNTEEIANRCNVELDIGNNYFPEFIVPNGENYDSWLHKLCEKGFEKKYKNSEIKTEARERLEFELSVIQKMGFSAYFLIVADFIDEAKKFCQVGPGRGSGAGSIVAYLLGITQLEPLSLGLLFERFLNPERVSLPDFDVDFGDRDKVLEYVADKYGHDKVALIGTYGTMMAKAVLKDVARAIDIPFEEANTITKFVNEKTIQKSLDLTDENGRFLNQELIDYKKKYPFLFQIAEKLEGTVRQPGIHACGVVWGPRIITDYLPIFSKDGTIVTQMDKDEVEERGLVKFDFLGLETLNIIQKVLDFIDKTGDWLEHIPMDDINVYNMLAKGSSCGVFQLESAGMQKTLQLVGPTGFDDIIAIVALYRPGPMQYLEVYANRKAGREIAKYPDKLAEEILQPTYGIIVYQEQVMQLAQKLAGFSMGEADVLRKAIGKKKLDLMQKMEGQFKSGCRTVAKMEEAIITQLWDDIVKFAAYSFNKSHAAAYALISYRTAYLKYYYPLEFYTALISSATNDPEKMAFYIQQARDEGIEILPPCVNKSEKNFSFEKNRNAILFGLSGVKNVGDTAIDIIIQNRPYINYQDFINKVDLSKVNKRVCKHLIMTGGFDEVNKQEHRNYLLSIYENVKKNDGAQNQKSLTGFFGSSISEKKIDTSKYPKTKLSDKLAYEKEVLDIAISGHLLDQYPVSKDRSYDKLSEIREGEEFRSFVIINRVKEIITKRGDKMAFLDVEDRNTSKSIVVFPNQFAALNGKLQEELPIIVEGIVRDKSLIASDIIFYKVEKKTEINSNKSEEKPEKPKSGLLNFC